MCIRDSVRNAKAPDPRLAKQEKGADAKTRELMQRAVTGGTTASRASSEFVAELVSDVRTKGDSKRGEMIYRRAELACTACHALRGQGPTIGPPLDAIGSGQPLDFIIGAVLEPQREIKEGYESLQIEMKNGSVTLGYRVGEDSEYLLLRDVGTGETVRIRRSDIASRRMAGSVMPSGLVDRLSREELRDLFAYLS